MTLTVIPGQRQGSCIRTYRVGKTIERRPCNNMKRCRDCRKRIRSRDTGSVMVRIGEATVYSFISPATPGAWARCRQNIALDGGQFIAMPREDGSKIVFTDLPKGEMVEDPSTAIYEAFMQIPDARHASSSAGWSFTAPHSPTGSRLDGKEEQPTYGCTVGWSEYRRISTEYGLRIHQISDRPDGGSVWEIDGLDDLGMIDYIAWSMAVGQYEIPRRKRKVIEPFDIFTPAKAA